jgi:hypothetical protein
MNMIIKVCEVLQAFNLSEQVVENQVLLAQAMNQERTSPPASCMVPHHHHICALWPKVWKAM